MYIAKDYDGTEYKFLTMDVAYKFQRILNKQRPTVDLTFGSSGCLTGNVSTYYQFNNRRVVEWDSNGNITKLDLPYIVLTWFKLSKFNKFLKVLWYGTKKSRA